MANIEVNRRRRHLQGAEGYLELGMPEHALLELARIADPGGDRFEFWYLKGQAQRDLRDHAAALVSLEQAQAVKPGHIGLLLTLAWCYKRVGRVDQSIEMMERAHLAAPKDALILYNLACYWAILGNKPQTLNWLGRALRMDDGYYDLIDNESDFDLLRDDPDFRLLVRRQKRRPPDES